MNPLDFKTFSLKGHRLIEASAGTGKTWTLTALYCRLIVERGVLPCNVLVVTFTNAATAELHWRIRKSITQLIAAYETDSPDDPLAEYFLSTVTASDALPRLHAALTGLDDARISTIHGFCQSILEQYALQMGHWFDYQLAENLFDEVEIWAQDYFRLNCYDNTDDSYFRGEILESPETLVERVGHLVVNSTPIKRFTEGNFNTYLNLIRTAWSLLREHWWGDHDVLVSYLLESKDLNRNSFRVNSVKSIINTIDNALSDFSCLFFKKADFGKFCLSKLVAGTKKGIEVFRHPFFSLCEEYAERLNDVYVAWEEQVRYDAIQDGRRTLHAKKRWLQVVSFDDLIDRLSEAVASSCELSDQVRQQCPYALIDEFQDTDSTQLNIFKSIYPDTHNHNLWLIGDPKQSIYRFRFADIHTYISARKAISAEARFTLGDNYRSSVGLVGGVNALFSLNSDAFKFYPDITFNATQASGPRSGSKLVVNDVPQQAWTCWELMSDPDSQHLTKEAFAQYEIVQIANEIQCLLSPGMCRIDDDPVDPNDIAIIVRSRREMTQIAEVLKQREIYCVIQDRSDVFATQEALDILEWLMAIEHRHHPSVVRRFIIGPLWGGALKAVDRLEDDSSEVQAVVSCLEQWSSDVYLVGCLGVLYKLLDLRAVGSRCRSQSNGDRRLTNWIHIAELITEDVVVTTGLNEAIRWIESKVIESGSKEVSSQLQRLESDENLVTVTTIHASKGLEFPIVFLPRLLMMSFGEPARRKEWGISYFDDEQGRSVLTVHPEPGDDVLHSEAHEEMAESVRQAYVGVTRASVKNYVSWGPLNKWDKTIFCHLMSNGDDVPTSGSDVLARWKRAAIDCLEIRPIDKRCAIANHEREAQPEQPLIALNFSRTINDGFSIVSYSALAPAASRKPGFDGGSDGASAGDDAVTERAPTEVSFDLNAFPRGPHVGNALHAVLEWIAKQATYPNGSALKGVLEQQLCLAGLDERWCEPLEQWVANIWNHVIHDDGWSLGSTALVDRVVEMEFYVPLHCQSGLILKVLRRYGYDVSYLRVTELNGYLRGFIDLVVQINHKFYVIDYKTNDLMMAPAHYHGTVLAKEIQEHHYQLQYLLYCVALHRYLERVKPGYDYAEHFGDVRYLFLRGMTPGLSPLTGVFVDRPSQACIEELSSVFSGVYSAG